MTIRRFALALLSAASLFGQARSRFSWQDYCFNHLSAPFCPGRDYAVKPTPKDKAARGVVSSPFSSPAARSAAASMIVLDGGIDWRFADPYADAMAGFNLSGILASPLAHGLLAQLGAKQGISDADMRKIFEGLPGVEQAALSVRNNRAVVMIVGSVAGMGLPATEPDLKTALISVNSMLTGHADAVDQANRRISFKMPPAELAQLAEALQAGSELWVIGSARLAGPQALSAGLKRFLLTVSFRDRLTGDLAFEFNGVPDANAVRAWQKSLGPGATLEGNALHMRMSMDAAEAQKQFAEILASPVGQQLGALIEGAKYLPVRDASAPKRTRPVIYGLDGGPREAGSHPAQ